MDVLNNIFTPHGHESAMKQALYNTLAFVFVLVFAVSGGALYFILDPFLQPLLWALLFGSVLYPFKRSLSQTLSDWLRSVQHVPLAVAVAALPLAAFDNVAHSCTNIVQKYFKLLAAVAGVVLIANYLPLSWFMRAVSLLNALYTLTAFIVAVFSSAFTAWLLVAVVGAAIFLFGHEERTQPILQIICPLTYLSLFCYATAMLGALRIPAIVCAVGLVVLGFFAEIEDRGRCGPKTSERASTKVYDRMSIVEITVARKMKLWYIRLKDLVCAPEPLPEPCDGDDANDDSGVNRDSPGAEDESLLSSPVYRPPPLIQVDDVDRRSREPTPVLVTSDDERDGSAESSEDSTVCHESDLYLIAVVWACVVVQVYRNLWFLPLLYIPLLYGMLKIVWGRLNLDEVVINFFGGLRGWYESRREAIAPDVVRHVVRLFLKGDSKIRYILEDSVDSITAVLVIILLFLVATIGTIFMAVQVYGESVHLIEVTSGVINRTVVHHPELQQLVPDTISNIQGALDSMIGDAYTYGKNWIRGSVRQLLDDKDDPAKAEALEAEIIELWDRIYQLWMRKNLTGMDEQLSESEGRSWNMLFSGLKSLDIDAITSFVKENLDTLQTVIDSLWVILKGNVTILISVFTAVVSLVFGGGTAVVNFVINFIVFTTALFYLLAASDATYRPIQLLSKAIPNSKGKPISGLSRAIEQAVNGVFALSFKMAFFYGLYTWLIHSLFGVNIIYIPSILAAIFGAVPFLGTYWACLPACLELWLVNGNPVRALIMFGVQILPVSFVDTAIYSEIKGGGHPYLTGLAVAGGVFCMGVQGALFGPMLLCVIIAACNVYSKLVQKSNQSTALAAFENSVVCDNHHLPAHHHRERSASPKPRMKKRASFSGQLVTDKFD